MIYATLDVDLCDDPAFERLQDENEGHPWRFIRLVTIAKRANRKGRVERADGATITVRELARNHDGRGEEYVRAWESFLSLCVELGLLAIDEDGCYRIEHWRRWHRSPSDEAELVRDRVSRHRKKRSNESADQCNERTSSCNESTDQGNERNDDCNGCNDTEQNQNQNQSRAEQNQSQIRAERKTESIDRSPPTPPQGADRPMDSGRYRSQGGDDAGGAPPTPPLRASPSDFASVDDAFSSYCREVSPKPLQGPDVQRLEELKAAARTRDATDREMLVALRYGVEATKWAMQSSAKPVKNSRAYLLACTLEILPRVLERSQDQRIAREQGWTEPAQIVWRAPDGSP